MRASRDTMLRNCAIFGSVGILGAIFLRRLHMHRDFFHFFERFLPKLENKNINTLCLCWRSAIFSFEIWIYVAILAILSPNIFRCPHRHKHFIIFLVISYTNIAEKAKNICAYVGVSRYFESKFQKIHFWPSGSKKQSPVKPAILVG